MATRTLNIYLPIDVTNRPKDHPFDRGSYQYLIDKI
jgi:hypothetical protein